MKKQEKRVEWVEELPEQLHKNKYEWFWDALREAPGRLAKFPGHAHGGYAYVRRHPDFEGKARGGVLYVWAKPRRGRPPKKNKP